MNRSGIVSRIAFAVSRRTRILSVGAVVVSLAVSAWAWQMPGGFGTDLGPLPPLGNPTETPAAQPGPAVQLPQPIYTNRPTFRIPFQFNPEEIARLGAREIRLYASANRGAQWHHVQTVEPAAQKFNFKASGDGEYWFTVQTVDRNNQLHPGGPVMQPGLIVVVDSTQPTLQILLQQGEPGRVQLAWTSSDEAVDPESLLLEFNQPGSTEWEQVAVISAASGQTSWPIPTGGIVAVRGRIRDRAGNEATAQSTVQINPAAAPARTPGIPDLRGPVAGATPGLTLPPATRPATPGGLTNPGPMPRPTGPNPYALDPRFQPTVPRPLTDLQTPGRLPGQTNPLPTPLNSDPRLAVPPRGISQPGQPEQWQHARTDISSPQGIRPAPGISEPFATRPGSGPQDFRQTIQPGRRDEFVSGQPGMARQQFPTFTQQNEDPGYRTVNSRKFHVDYRIDDIGPSGVSSVELYVTQNNGEKWYRYGIDEDRRSPFEVEVPGDGVYGFSMRVVSGAGLVETPPQSGTRPDIVIVTDSSPPVVNLFPLRQGTGQNANRILITWEIRDRKLGDRPVSLSYSANPDGPWEPINDWMSNTGQYIWSVNPSIPPRLYIRLIARDAAGNIAQVDTPQPVLVDLAKPTARIVDVESSVTRSARNY